MFAKLFSTVIQFSRIFPFVKQVARRKVIFQPYQNNGANKSERKVAEVVQCKQQYIKSEQLKMNSIFSARVYGGMVPRAHDRERLSESMCPAFSC